MAHSIVPNVYINAARNLVINTCIVGDGASGELAAAQFLDASTYSATNLRILSVKTALVGFSAKLLWDADTDTHLISLPDYEFAQDYRRFGGINNNAGAGKTGDIMITTFGLAASTLEGHIILELAKA